MADTEILLDPGDPHQKIVRSITRNRNITNLLSIIVIVTFPGWTVIRSVYCWESSVFMGVLYYLCQAELLIWLFEFGALVALVVMLTRLTKHDPGGREAPITKMSNMVPKTWRDSASVMPSGPGIWTFLLAFVAIGIVVFQLVLYWVFDWDSMFWSWDSSLWSSA